MVLVTEYYRDLPSSLSLLFCLATGGSDWSQLAELHGKVSANLRISLVIYMAIMIFLIAPITYGTYANTLNERQRVDTYASLHRRTAEANRFAKDLKHHFEEAGISFHDDITPE